ncbi:MAG: T9SS type A sorting domain-containing protein [Bacteroidetes bacterium]|nr:T9SS type A sorting domain-containing protein [Bacteroidota bacterium]
MKKILFSILIVIFSLGSYTAQTFNGRLNPSPAQNPEILNSGDTLKILCALVEFQEDKFDQTYGSGKFGTIYTKDYGTSIIDPLPHDLNYFSNHMKFAENYFRKVSNGKANISYSFLPDIITVSQPMRNYSPPQNSETFSELGELAQEVWQNADQRFPDFNYSDFDLFIVFHAGVGRDIVEVTIDFGRFDLPSIYLSNNQLKKIYGNDFEGFQVQNASFKINNTAILPETESREVSGIGQTVLLELTINGLIVSTIASHLGLPDLFNTETGRTAIGRFGLMDGQSFFAYSGLFPPEPSPWEKIYLGWEQAETVQPGSYNINLAAKNAAAAGDTTILKVPINSSEYFLIENRKRDAYKNGAVITSIVNGQTKIQTFAKDDTAGFNPFNIELIDGVVIDIDEYDWALPGFEDEQLLTDPFYDMGIVIWHIDESIINSNITDNKINSDQKNKGIKIVEADGIIDIGEEFRSIFGDIVVGEGTRQDTWYQENPSEYYENKFTPDSKPNTNSNTGGNSLINIVDFSPIGNKMSFKLSYSSPYVSLNFSEKISSSEKPTSVKSIVFNNSIYSFIKSGTSLSVFKEDQPIYKISNEITDDFLIFEKGSSLFAVYPSQNILSYFQLNGAAVSQGSIDAVSTISAPIVASINEDESINLFVGNNIGFVTKYVIAADGSFENAALQDFSLFNEPVNQIAVNNDVLTASASNKLFTASANIIQFPNEILKHVLTKDKNGNYISVVLTEGNLFNFVKNGEVESSFFVNSNNVIADFSVGDLFEDGNNYIVLNDGNKVKAFNFAGALVDGFPFINTSSKYFTGTPSIADFNNDGKIEVAITTEDGRILAFTPGDKNKLAEGLNLTAGAVISAPLFIYKDQNNFGISAVNGNGYFYNWNYKSTNGKLLWTGKFGNNLNASFAESAKLTNTFNEYFPADKVYNWPNPVYEGETYIRFYVAEDSKVNVKIFDLAGDFVAELTSDAIGGLYNEIPWNINSVSSGVYFARIEASGNSGAAANKIIKIAVIK